MKKNLLRWAACVAIVLIGIFAAALIFLDPIARLIAERHVRAETGLETSIGKISVGLVSPVIRIEHFTLKNAPEFGGETFIDIPEIHVEYDRPALRSGTLHLKFVRININKVHLVESKDRKRNNDDLQKRQIKTSSGKSGKAQPAFAFAGIDKLDVTLGTVQFTNLKNPAENINQDLGIKNEVFKNLKEEKDFQTVAALLALKAGGGLWMNGQLTNIGAFLAPPQKSRKEVEYLSNEISPASSATNSQP